MLFFIILTYAPAIIYIALMIWVLVKSKTKISKISALLSLGVLAFEWLDAMHPHGNVGPTARALEAGLAPLTSLFSAVIVYLFCWSLLTLLKKLYLLIKRKATIKYLWPTMLLPVILLSLITYGATTFYYWQWKDDKAASLKHRKKN